MNKSIRILGVGMSFMLAFNCCLVSLGATFETGIDVGNYMTVQTGQKSERFEINTEKFAEMKREAKNKGLSNVQLTERLLQATGVQENSQLTQRLSETIAAAKSVICGV